MMIFRRSGHTLAALMLLAAFGLGLLAALVAGTGSYARLTENSRHAYDRRTGGAYLSARVRQSQGCKVLPLGGNDTLCLYENLGGREYVTYIYCQEGWLMELFTSASGEFAPEDGERVLPMESLTPKLEDGLLTVRFTSSAGSQVLYFDLGEVSP